MDPSFLKKCAKCSVRTDYPAHKTLSRRLITRDWMRNLICRHNSEPTNQNRYICGACIRDLYKKSDRYFRDMGFELGALELSYPRESILIEENIGSANIPSNELDFELISDQRCMVLTGIKIDQLKELSSDFVNIKPPVKLSIINCIGFYLMKLRLGISSTELGYIAFSKILSTYLVKEV